jgi:hypothetical protein
MCASVMKLKVTKKHPQTERQHPVFLQYKIKFADH